MGVKLGGMQRTNEGSAERARRLLRLSPAALRAELEREAGVMGRETAEDPYPGEIDPW